MQTNSFSPKPGSTAPPSRAMRALQQQQLQTNGDLGQTASISEKLMNPKESFTPSSPTAYGYGREAEEYKWHAEGTKTSYGYGREAEEYQWEAERLGLT